MLNFDIFRNLCARIWEATPKSVIEKGSSHILRLFEDGNYVRSIVVNPAKMKNLLKNFPKTEIVTIGELQIVTK